MRRWMIAVTAMLLMPWMVSLVWMRAEGMESEVAAREAAGQAENGEKTEYGKAAESASDSGDGEEAALTGGGKAYAGGTGEAAADKRAVVGSAKAGQEADGAIRDADARAGTGMLQGDAAAPEKAGNPESSGQELIRRKILVERKGIRTYIDLEDYLPGVMACQIDGDYEMEALKCQAVIARTYIHRLMDGRTEIYEEELDMDYLGEGEEYQGENREKLLGRLKRCQEAAEATRGVVMQYENRCILPLFHGISAGRTRTGAADFPYLQSVESTADTKREDYMQVLEWSCPEFAAAVSRIPGAAAVTADQVPGQIQTVKKDDAGYMEEIRIGTGTCTGDEIQYALGLPSPCFSLEGNGDIIRVRVRGKGHGYGLSQAGADAMAKSGWGYEDILNHYYKNISLISE